MEEKGKAAWFNVRKNVRTQCVGNKKVLKENCTPKSYLPKSGRAPHDQHSGVRACVCVFVGGGVSVCLSVHWLRTMTINCLVAAFTFGRLPGMTARVRVRARVRAQGV